MGGHDENARHMNGTLPADPAEGCGPPVAPGEVDPLTDMGNALRFQAEHSAHVRYVYFGDGGDGRWYTYDGRRWAANPALVQQLAQETAARLMAEARERKKATDAALEDATATGDKDKIAVAKGKAGYADAVVAHARRTQNAGGLASMLSTVACKVGAKSTDFDRDPWALNVANGTLDLRTGALRAHRREDMVSKLSPIAYSQRAECPTWRAFLERVQPDKGIRDFLQRLAGYSFTGTTREHALVIHYGSGRNGKGVYMNSLLHTAGDYGRAIPPEILMVKKGEAHPTGLTLLWGTRLASSQETKEGAALDVPTVKALTSEDRVTARRMAEDFWEFEPTHHINIATNHKPRISETKNAIWDRVILIPWDVVIPEEERDRSLEVKLRAEAPGILRWIVEGALEYLAKGLAAPASVIAAKDAYRAQQDSLGAFLAERCALEPAGRITRAALFRLYKDWCTAAGEEDVLGATAFAEKVREHGCEDTKIRTNVGSERGWKGIRAKTSSERATDAQGAEDLSAAEGWN